LTRFDVVTRSLRCVTFLIFLIFANLLLTVYSTFEQTRLLAISLFLLSFGFDSDKSGHIEQNLILGFVVELYPRSVGFVGLV
jgi:hypothetical protein